MDRIPPAPMDLMIATAQLIAAHGVYGMIWTDADLRVEHRLGPLVDFVDVGASLTEVIAPLLGLEPQIEDLKRDPSHSVAIPNIALDAAQRDAPRVNLALYWIPERASYALLVARAVPRSDLEVELTAQVRARAMAEADATAKSRIIARTNEELTRANLDLREFASVISHDLRSPLRRLRYFAAHAADALEAADGDTLAADLARIGEQAKRMGAMLTGLLEYSRIGRKSEVIEDVDTAALVAEIVASLARPPGVEIAIAGSWPRLRTLAQPLDITLRNLIENAVKHHDRETGRIGVTAAPEGEFLRLTIDDDGPGIPPQWHDAIFEPFKRIADDEEAPEGAGIGLALVKKTIVWCGGRIEVKSNPAAGRGATFIVHWPTTIPGVEPEPTTPISGAH